ncbi:MAG: PAS domain S-box protein [Actinobacteria bacterium]|nr:PAS domain S-box protein [Actinomycetota bacterium]MBU1943474.1 PAS domain S-box protein [Actinomycetota bacterium]MBU2686831.1 PAS domain S-box protein [Actinomycetota bacterium]
MTDVEKDPGFLESAIDTLQDIFIVFDLGGRLLRWNLRGVEVTGYDEDELADMNIRNFLGNGDFERVSAAIALGIQEGYASVETDLICRDGEGIPYEFYGTPLLDGAGNVFAVTAIGRDITERRKLLEKEREASAAEAARAEAEKYLLELQDLITVAAHELRHPATVFKGYSRLLLDRMDRMDPVAVKDALRAISDSADRLAHLVAELFETALIERRKLELEYGDALPSELMACSLQRALEMGTEDQSAVAVNPGRGPERPIRLDPHKSEEVLAILIENAVKYSPAGAPVDVWFEQDSAETVFHVDDRGPGIPEQATERVFDRFYQVEDTRYHSIPGLGLGLYIARSIVEAHGGRISIEPREGGGCAFFFSLPNRPVEQGADR